MRRFAPVLALAALSLALALPSHAATTVASGTVNYSPRDGGDSGWVAYAAGGCASDVTSGVTAAVIDISKYTGKVLKLYGVSAATDEVPLSQRVITAKRYSTCDAMASGVSVGDSANKAHPAVFVAKGKFITIYPSDPLTINVDYRLTVG